MLEDRGVEEGDVQARLCKEYDEDDGFPGACDQKGPLDGPCLGHMPRKSRAPKSQEL